MAKKTLLPAGSPYTVFFPKDSEVLGDESFNIDRSGGDAIVYLPAIADLTQTLNQKVVVTNLDASSATIVYPAADDSICGGPLGSGVYIGSGFGAVWRFQPASDHIWGCVKCPDNLSFRTLPVQ